MKTFKQFINEAKTKVDDNILEYAQGGGGGTVAAPAALSDFVDKIPERVGGALEKIFKKPKKTETKPTPQPFQKFN